MERLDKIIASQGVYSRKDVKQLVRSGRITVDGKTPASSDVKVDADKSVITIDSKELCVKKHIYIMMNKPKGVVSATRDDDTPTVIDILPDEFKVRKGLFPAGRLDKDTEGFVLITDDGDFAHRILSPKKHVSKTYLATLKKPFDETIIEKFLSGVELKDGSVCLSAEAELISGGENPVVKVILHEGMYHQIKRMFAACQNEVIALKRIKMGNLNLDESLAFGECREILPKELDMILYENNPKK